MLSRITEFRYRHEFAYRWVRNGALLVGAGFLFGLGIFAATGLDDRTTTEVIRYPRAGAGALLSTATAGNEAAEVITETVRRKGKVVRVIRHRKGDPVVRTLPGLGTTIRGTLNTQTVTTRVVNTVTVVQQVTVAAPPETVTVIETVTCKPSDC